MWVWYCLTRYTVCSLTCGFVTDSPNLRFEGISRDSGTHSSFTPCSMCEVQTVDLLASRPVVYRPFFLTGFEKDSVGVPTHLYILTLFFTFIWCRRLLLSMHLSTSVPPQSPSLLFIGLVLMCPCYLKCCDFQIKETPFMTIYPNYSRITYSD